MSLLSPHFMKTNTLPQWLNAKPRVMKFTPMALGASNDVPAGSKTLCVGKIDQDAGGSQNWKALMAAGHTAEDAALARYLQARDTIVPHPRIKAWEFDNEVVPDTVAEAQWYDAYNVALMGRLENVGQQLVLFNFATGTPEFWVWPHLLPALSHATQHGHYLGLHEYMAHDPSLGAGHNQPGGGFFGVEGDEDFGWSALRYRAVYRNILEPAGLGWLELIITECGHDDISFSPPGMPRGSWTAMGLTPAQYVANLIWYDERLREDRARGRRIIGATVFTSGSTLMWRDYDITGEVENRLLAYVTETNGDDPELPPYVPPTLPPVEPPPTGGNAVNLLVNPSFEDGWTDIDGETQEPNGWRVGWNIGGTYNAMKGEVTHKSDALMPPEERGIFIWDGSWALKAFGGRKNIWFRLIQELELPAGRYRLSTPTWVDCYRWDKINRVKDYNLEPDHAQFMVKVNGEEIGGWRWLLTGGLRQVVTEFEHDGGECKLAIHYRTRYAEENNFWLDGWNLAKADGTPPVTPPVTPKHKAIIVLLPQDMTEGEMVEAARLAYPFRHTMTPSHDDAFTMLNAGNVESYAKIFKPERQPERVRMIEDAGYRWEEFPPHPPTAPLAFEVWPVSGARTITQAFGARPEYYAQFGLPGHEGVDLRAALDAPVKSMARGVVAKVTTTGNYGNRIDVRTGEWTITYAHLNRFAGLAVGAPVTVGQVVGYAGNTGNSSAVHLHVGLKHATRTYTSPTGVAWPFNLFDPTPYLRPLMTAGGSIDLLPYLRGDGRMYEVRHPNGATETFQTQADPDGRFWQVKNSQWEELYGDNTHIWRGVDTSPGEGRFYVQFEPGLKRARWMMRWMSVGQTWSGPGHKVQFYNKADCSPSAANSGNATNSITFVAHHTARMWNGITLNDVVELTSGAETYYYAKGYGLVAWSSVWGGDAAICQILEGRPSLTRETLDCSY